MPVFDTPKYAVKALKHLLRAKAVLCPGLTIDFKNDANAEDNEVWCFEAGLSQYLSRALGEQEILPEAPFVGSLRAKKRPWIGHCLSVA